MQLALFDLDNTLIPMDSDHAWGEFMVKIGAVDAARHRAQNDQFYRDYQAGCLDNNAYLDFQLAPLAKYTRSQLNEWHRLYMEESILPNIRPEAVALVKKHQDAGDLCALVTATNEFVTAPIAKLFGLEHLIATQLATVSPEAGAAYTGKATGIPNFREGKVLRTQAWLEQFGTTFASYSASYFYSDSANDIPLLEKVSHPVATNPDAKLKALSQANGWTILELFKTS
jgi:HAD superfamily hydrolase (TIGR01490 family)